MFRKIIKWIIKRLSSIVEDEEESGDESLSAFYQRQLEQVASDFVLGKITIQEYERLSRALNDSALSVAEKKLNELEDYYD